MNPIHEQFIAEARDLIHDASDNLIALERDGLENDRIDRVFRAFHTLKGAAGVVGLLLGNRRILGPARRVTLLLLLLANSRGNLDALAGPHATATELHHQ